VCINETKSRRVSEGGGGYRCHFLVHRGESHSGHGSPPKQKKKQLMPLGPKFQKNSKPSSVDLVLGDRAKINFADFRDSALLK